MASESQNAKKDHRIKLEKTARDENHVKRKWAYVHIDGEQLRHLMNPKTSLLPEFPDHQVGVGGQNKVKRVNEKGWESRRRVKMGRGKGAVRRLSQTRLRKMKGKHARDGGKQQELGEDDEDDVKIIDDGMQQEPGEDDDDDDDNVEIIGENEFADEMVKVESPYKFRDEVLKVLEEPFDKGEYQRYNDLIKTGSYLEHYPDLKSKLKEHRYQRGKRLVVLRGFFFWLQNLTREGSFEPWTDRECLAVKPPPASSTSSN